MKVFTTIIFLILFSFSCAVLKKDSLSNKQSNTNKHEIAVIKSFNDHLSNSWVINDSLNSDATLTIWPKGIFTYSSEMGFRGEAVKVQLINKIQQVKNSKIVKDRTIEKQIKSLTKARAASNNSKVESHRFKWQRNYVIVVILIIAIVGLVYWLAKR
ncbi:hypothetical protein [Pedobacter mucosus]|uniref:hypothetical protein n=1 Tax=Pedobacter mucosus TaxID=2895286 RepID=UPI001EE4E534|nr:hypothetical protein [Pedobacter mucosus]UKT63258.1 hypothetical protein LOK61_15990 [Pedobacter mucosus]